MAARAWHGALAGAAAGVPPALRQPMAFAARAACPRTAVLALVRELGFDGLSYFAQPADVALRGAALAEAGFAWTTAAPEWLPHYRRSGFAATDPRLALTRHVAPFLWDAVRCGRNAAARPFLAAAATHGIASGAVVQLRDALGERIVVAFDSACPTLDAARIELFLERLGSLMVVATTLHDWVFAPRRRTRPRATLRDASLSACELRCLALAAQGRTSREIGCLLAIARRTADFHVHNAIRKLGAQNRSEAIGRAIALDLIEPASRRAPSAGLARPGRAHPGRELARERGAEAA